MKKIIAGLFGVIIAVSVYAAQDGGLYNKAVGYPGSLLTTKVGEWGAKSLTVINSGTNVVYCNVNGTVAEVAVNAVSGTGSVAIAVSGSYTWEGNNIGSIAIGCVTGYASTVTLQFHTM